MLQRKLIYAGILCLIALCPSSSLFAQVNLQTGSAVFSLPMFNWKDDKSRLASGVALSYSSGSGLKVNDVASNAGQGWSLVAGGVITRMQVGEPDDQKAYPGSLSSGGNEIDADPSKFPAGWLYATVPPANGCPNALTKYPIYRNMNQIYSQHNITAEDKQQDYFAFQFNGKAGLFIVDTTGGNTCLSLGDNRLKITYQTDPSLFGQGIRTTITSFTIQDVDGLIYKFTQHGLTTLLRAEYCDPSLTQHMDQPTFGKKNVYHQAGFPDPDLIYTQVIGSWYLSEVDDPLTQRKILFSYTPVTISNTAGADVSYNLNDEYAIISHKTSVTTTPEISSITYPDGHLVNFTYATNFRVDLSGEKALSSVDISYQGRYLSEYQLNTSYFIQNSYGTPTNAVQNSVSRLCLRSVKKLGVDLKADSPPYIFDYYLGSSNPDDFVPPPFFYAKDIWGFYNGSNTTAYDGSPMPLNTTISQLDWNQVKGLCFIQPTGSTSSAPVLNPKQGYAKNGLLKQVIYPTGGTLTYQYDQNTGVLTPGSAETMVGGVHVSQTSSTDGGYSNGCANPVVTQYKYVLGDESSSSLWGLEMPVNVIVTRNHYNSEQLKHHWAWSCATPFGCCYWKYAYPGILSQLESVSLTDFQKFMESIAPILGIVTIITDIMDIVTIAGGSTGVLAIAAVIVDYIGAVLTFGLTCGSSDNSKDNTYNIFYNLDLNGASPLPTQFKRVEIIEGSGTMGKTVRQFTSDDDYSIFVGPGANGDFSAKQRFFAWEYGLPRFTTQYDVNGNIIKQVENRYNIFTRQLYDGGIPFSKVPTGTPITDCKCTVNHAYSQNNTDWTDPTKYNLAYLTSSNSDMTVDMYGMYTGRAELASTYERVYRTTDATQYVETVSTYQYDPYNYQVSSVSTTQSDGKQYSKFFTYADTYAYLNSPVTNNPVINALFNNNILNEPIAVSQSVGTMIDEKVTVYGTLANGNIAPGTILQQRFAQPTNASIYNPDDNTNGTKYKIIQTLSYDANGNLNGLQDEGGRSVTNIYDYNDKYIVASVINANPLVDAPAYTSFETSGFGGWVLTGSSAYGSNAITGTRSFVLGSGNNFSAPINSAKPYTVSLWATAAVSVNGGLSPVKSAPTINGFTYYEYTIPAGSSTAVVTGSATIDELRLYPSTARMKTTTYDPLIGKISECDENNRVTYFEYDNLGRLRFIKDENHNALKMYEYNNVSAARQNGCPGTYSNNLINEVFTRSNCGTGYLGGNVIFTVPAGQFTSSISQADADAQAQTYLLINGQANADATGACQVLYYNIAYSIQDTTQTCVEGQKGGVITYSVPAGRYSSIVSQAAANQLALDDLSANAQSYANSPSHMSCSLDTSPDWDYADGGPTSCQTVGGVGHIFYLATDINPNSSTYNQSQWMDAGASASCPAMPTIYAQLSFQNMYIDAYGQERGDVVVSFYSDNACTQPLSVTNLLVNYTETWEFNNIPGSGNITANGTSTAILAGAVLSAPDPTCDPSSQICQMYNYDYVLASGNYIIK